MSQSAKYEYALRLLKELNCPKEIMVALEIWGMFVSEDEVKLNNWLTPGGIIDGEVTELPDKQITLQ